MVDTFSITAKYQKILYEKVNLAPGQHVLAVEVTGQKNPASTGKSIHVDAFDVLNGTMQAAAFIELLPEAPVGLKEAVTENGVELTWDKSTDKNTTRYTIYRTTLSGNYSKTNKIGSVKASGSPSYTDTDVLDPGTYCYVITAVDSAKNESEWSAEIAVTIVPAVDTTVPEAPQEVENVDTTAPEAPQEVESVDTPAPETPQEVESVEDKMPPSAPADLTGQKDVIEGKIAGIQLTWAPSTESDIEGYNIYRSSDAAAGFTKINDSLVANADYYDKNAASFEGETAQTCVYYYVIAVDQNGNESQPSVMLIIELLTECAAESVN